VTDGGLRPDAGAELAREAVAEAVGRNMVLWIEAGELRFRAPRGALTPSLREALIRAKAAIVDLLGEGRRCAPASFSQQRLWFIDQWEPGGRTAHLR